MKRLYIFIIILITAFALKAQAPAGYYNDAAGKTGNELKAALHDIIDEHTTISYGNIWNAFKNTDNKGDNLVWDMYSEGAGYTYYYNNSPSDQCGDYEQEGDCFNREHSWPKSWFNGDEETVPGRDLHHIFPTDGFVNYKRSDNPFGEVQSATWTSANGSKLGTCKSSLGYNGTVFEPIDEYKGDFARALMYMSVRYYGEDSDWGTSGMTNKSVLKDWAIAMLLDWHRKDPVSDKERARNNVIYSTYQHNRNPFVDNMDFAEMIWDPNWSENYQIYATANPTNGGEASVTPTVTGTVAIDFSEQGYANEQLITSATIDDNVSVAFNKGTNSNAPKYYSSGTAIRCYGGNYFTISTAVGTISSIKLTYGGSDGSNTITTDVGTFSDDAWAGDASSVKFTIGGSSGNRRIKAIAVTYSYEGSPVAQATCAYGSKAKLTATPSTGWHFVNWTKGGTEVSNEATVIVTVSESATYQANFEINTYTISVAANTGGSAFIGDSPSPTSQKVSIDLSNQGFSNEQNMNGTNISIDDNVKVVFSTNTGNNPPKYYTNGSSVRCYGGNKFVVSTTSGSITKITLTYGDGDGSNAITTNAGSFSTPNWTGNATSVTFTIGGTSGHRRINKIEVTYSGEPATQATFNYGASATISAAPNTGYSFVNWTKSSENVSPNITYTFTVSDNGSYVANFIGNNVAENVTVPSLTLNGTVTVGSGATLAIAGAITQTSGSTIVINDSGQLVNATSGISGKVKKNITKWNTSPSTVGWHAISTPVNNVAFANVTNLTSSTYNVYRLNETTLTWENCQNSANQFSSFTNGRGYVYRKGDNTAIEFNGTFNVSDVNYPLTYTSEATKGFHLIGNPYPHNIYKGANAAIANTYLEEGFYTITSSGECIAGTDHSTAIAPCQAILVQAKSTVSNPTNLTITKTTSTGLTKGDDDNIMFVVSNSNYKDVAYAMFKDGHGLNKIEHRNEAIHKLYIQNMGEEFAIADIDRDAKAFNLNFHATTTGIYTMKIKPHGDFSYLRLIDRMTGNDVDLLIDDEYSFVGSPQDSDARFIVRLEFADSFVDQETSSFAYQSGNEIIVRGDGLLQVYDALGRLIVTREINHTGIVDVSSLQTGVYILRMTDDDVRTQKIIVK